MTVEEYVQSLITRFQSQLSRVAVQDDPSLEDLMELHKDPLTDLVTQVDSVLRPIGLGIFDPDKYHSTAAAVWNMMEPVLIERYLDGFEDAQLRYWDEAYDAGLAAGYGAKYAFSDDDGLVDSED